MQPEACIPLPQGNSDSVKEVFGAGRSVLGGDSLGDGFPDRADDGDGVLGQSSQSVGHNGDEIHPCRAAG